MSGPTPHQVLLLAGQQPSLWQRTVLKAFAGEALDKEELRAFRKMTSTWIAKPRKGGYDELVVDAGRQSGKDSFLAAPIAVAAALGDPSKWNIAPGMTAKIVIVGPKLQNCEQFLDAMGGLLTSIGIEHKRTDLAIVIADRNVEVQAWVADHRVRGITAILVIATESAFLPTEEGADGHDVEVFAALNPMRVTTGGPLISISTPWRKAGVHHQKVEEFFGKTDSDVLVVRGASWEFNPAKITEERTRQLERNPVRWAREYKAVIGDDEGSFLARTDVIACISEGVVELEPMAGATCAMSIDAAFRADAFVIMVAHKEIEFLPNAPPREYVVIDLIRHFTPKEGQKLDFDWVMQQVASVARRYRVKTVHRDSFSGDAIDARLKASGLRSVEAPMNATAQQIRFELLARLVRARDIKLLDHAAMQKELVDLRVKKRQMGRLEISAPSKRGYHDDIADALALVVEAAMQLPASTPGVECDMQVSFGEGGVDVQTAWFERRLNPNTGLMHRMPRMPPWGSEAFIAQANQLRLSGQFTPETLRWFEQNPPDDGGEKPPFLNAEVFNE